MNRSDLLQTLTDYRQRKQVDYKILKLGVFGSVARDQITDQSDVDVMVELGYPDLFIMVGIKQDLEELLQRPVDIVRYRPTINDFLKRRIEREAVYV
ncbi:MAG: nucleotidyltransferase domain-containing protein [Chloroflexota bacterium]|nr:nucleotidyltransferase domain-containing protein [Chloroflexota bacterium]